MNLRSGGPTPSGARTESKNRGRRPGVIMKGELESNAAQATDNIIGTASIPLPVFSTRRRFRTLPALHTRFDK